MQNMGLVYGSAAQAKPLMIGVDTVYVHTDIQKVDRMPNGEEVTDMYCYNEVQYTLAEYLDLQIKENQQLGVKQIAMEAALIAAQQEITDRELAEIELGQQVTDLELMILEVL